MAGWLRTKGQVVEGPAPVDVCGERLGGSSYIDKGGIPLEALTLWNNFFCFKRILINVQYQKSPYVQLFILGCMT